MAKASLVELEARVLERWRERQSRPLSDLVLYQRSEWCRRLREGIASASKR